MTAPSLAAMLTSPGWRDVVVLGGGQEPGPTLIGSRVLMNVAGHPEPMAGELLVVLLATDHSDWRIDALSRSAKATGDALKKSAKAVGRFLRLDDQDTKPDPPPR